jgi:hypothetical protein
MQFFLQIKKIPSSCKPPMTSSRCPCNSSSQLKKKFLLHVSRQYQFSPSQTPVSFIVSLVEEILETIAEQFHKEESTQPIYQAKIW